MDENNLQAETPAELPPVEPVAESAPAVETPPEPVKDRVQERIDKLTREKYDALRERDALSYRLQALEEKPAPPPPVAPVAAPTLAQFEYDEAKFAAAMTAYAESIADRRVTTRLTEWEQKQTFRQREAEFAEKTPDYAAKVYDPTLPFTNDMATVIAGSENGPQLAYYLAENRAEAARIAAMPAIQAARELGKIEARLTAPPAPRVSKAPPPPPRIQTGEGSLDVRASEPDSDKLSDAEWWSRREKELKRKKG